MKKTRYSGHEIELVSDRLPSGTWTARANVLIRQDKAETRIPIFGRRRMTFESKIEANGYALELAKLWIDGRLCGGNGRG